MRNGLFSIVNISESHKTGNAVLLSDILEVEVPQKYFLSKEQTERIIFTESDKSGGAVRENRNNPNRYRTYSPDGCGPCLDDMGGGGRGPHTIEVIGTLDPNRHSQMDVMGVFLGGGIAVSGYSQRTEESSVITVGNTNPSGNGMNGNCYFSEGLNPTLTCNKNEGNRVAIPVLTPERANKRQNGRRFKEDGDEAFTLTAQDRHGVAISVQPMEMSGHKLSESKDEAHTLNCTDQQSDDDGSGDMFAIDKGIRPEERKIANCIESREDRGLSKRKQEGTLICLKA